MRLPDPRPKNLVRLHFIAMCFWAANLPMLALRPIRESVPYIAFCSVYANFVGHFGGWDAARSEEKVDDN